MDAARASRTRSRSATFDLPMTEKGPDQVVASGAAVRRRSAEVLFVSVVVGAQRTPGGRPSTPSSISPLKFSRRKARTLRGMVSPRRRSGVQSGASLESLLGGGGGGGRATSRKSGFSLRSERR